MEILEHPRLYNNESNSVIEINHSPFTLGRGLNCDYVLTNNVISRLHCQFEKTGSDWYLRDSSSNGTYVNNNLIHKDISLVLKDSDVIRLTQSSSHYSFRLTPREDITDEQLCMIADSVLGDIDTASSNLPGISCSGCATKTNNEPRMINVGTIRISDGPIPISTIDVSDSKSRVDESVIDLTGDSFRHADRPSTSNEAMVIDLSESVSQIDPETNNPDSVSHSDGNKDNEPAQSIQPSTSTTSNVKPKEEAEGDPPVDEELLCAICSEMFVKATTLNCSHTFCRVCINTWILKQEVCPICRSKITSKASTLVLDNIIDKVIQHSSEAVQEHRKGLIEDRSKLDTNKEPSRITPRYEDSIMELLESDDDTENGSTDSIDSADWQTEYLNDDWYNRRGRPPYYGGYGHCYSCGAEGHWANGCPYRS